MTASTLARPTASLCGHCHSMTGEPQHRGLCGACYSDAVVRSCYSTDGRKVADPPPARLGWDDQADEDDGEASPAAETPPIAIRAPITRFMRTPASDAADEAAVLKAVDLLTAAGHYRTAEGEPAAGLHGVAREAQLSPPRSNGAAARLVARGTLERVTTRYNPDPNRLGGRPAEAVRRVTDQCGAAAPPRQTEGSNNHDDETHCHDGHAERR